jgi:hypothetical protein
MVQFVTLLHTTFCGAPPPLCPIERGEKVVRIMRIAIKK